MSAPTPRAYVIPAPLARALSLVPSYPQRLAFVTGLNFLLLRHLPADVLAAEATAFMGCCSAWKPPPVERSLRSGGGPRKR